jgi:hypothetical protein
MQTHVAGRRQRTPHAQGCRGTVRSGHASSLTGGGTDGNTQLTATVGMILVVLLAVIGVTILRISQLISVHLFVGLLLIGPVGLKLASTGYRFARYYTHDRAYREKGPPQPILRLIAPIVVLMTVTVFASGVALLFEGPHNRGSLLLIHKASFVVWIAFTALHVLGHLSGLGGDLRAARPAIPGRPSPGSSGRWLALTGALVGGLVLAIALIPDFSAWTAHAAVLHRHHD